MTKIVVFSAADIPRLVERLRRADGGAGRCDQGKLLSFVAECVACSAVHAAAKIRPTHADDFPATALRRM
jgi:hypothetical protein